VREVFVKFSSEFDPPILWMYLDRAGLVRTGIDCLLEPIDKALIVSWTSRNDGHKAEPNEISADWVRVKKNRLLAHHGPARAQFMTNLDLSSEGIEQLVKGQLDAYESDVGQILPEQDWEAYPANVQLVMLSMLWVTGGANQFIAGWRPDSGVNAEGTRWARFLTAMRESAWTTAAEHCFLDDSRNARIQPRNWAHRKLLKAAATTETPEKVTGWP